MVSILEAMALGMEEKERIPLGGFKQAYKKELINDYV